MKHFIKGFLLIVTIILAVTAFSSSSFAKGNNGTKSFYDPEIGSMITPLKESKNGLEPMSQEEYENLTKTKRKESPPVSLNLAPAQPKIDYVINGATYYEYYRFYHTRGTDIFYGGVRKVTATVDCTASSCSIGTGYSTTISATYSASTSLEKSAITAGASFSFQKSLTSINDYGFVIDNGDYGYLGFKPLLKTAYGDLKKYSSDGGTLSSKVASGTSPVKLSNGEADGIYLFVHQ